MEKRLFALGVVAGFVGSAMFMWYAWGMPVIAQAIPDQSRVVRAERFLLIDDHGRSRALLSLSAEGEPYLALTDRNDVTRVWIGLARSSGVALRDIDGKTRAMLSLDDTGEPSLVVRDRSQRTRSFQP